MSATAVDAATAALRNLIARGRYLPGDRLPPERELVEGLGLSRPTLREAIRRLTDAGILEPRRGSGTYVAQVDADSVFAVRLQLEPYAAGLAALHRQPGDARRLVTLAEELRRTLDEPETFAAVDLEVHRIVSGATGNPILAGILERLTEMTQLTRAVTSPEREARLATLDDLRALVRAIRARDAGGAETAMRQHLEILRRIAQRRRPADRSVHNLMGR
jgi:GntR family transcriptional repressor for pyruvate dehydrogenase complex